MRQMLLTGKVNAKHRNNDDEKFRSEPLLFYLTINILYMLIVTTTTFIHSSGEYKLFHFVNNILYFF